MAGRYMAFCFLQLLLLTSSCLRDRDPARRNERIQLVEVEMLIEWPSQKRLLLVKRF
jgi:hypothetical protein